MEEEDIGSLPVVREGARLVAIVTDRDPVVVRENELVGMFAQGRRRPDEQGEEDG